MAMASKTLSKERILQRCDALYAQSRRVRLSETRAHINAMRDALLWAAGELSDHGDDDIPEFLTDDYLHDYLAPSITREDVRAMFHGGSKP